LLWFVPLDWHDPLSLQVDSLSFHLVQSLPVTSEAPDASVRESIATKLTRLMIKLARRGDWAK